MYEKEIFERSLKGEEEGNPDICAYCPFIDYEKTDDEYAFVQ